MEVKKMRTDNDNANGSDNDSGGITLRRNSDMKEKNRTHKHKVSERKNTTHADDDSKCFVHI